MKKEAGFTLIELLIVTAILGIISAIAVPNLLRARHAAQESTAIRYVRSWSPGQELHRRAKGHYASTDEDLIKEGFISRALNGAGNADDFAYSYSIDSESFVGGNPNPHWFGRARRVAPTYKTRSFYIDETGLIRQSHNSVANADDPPLAD